MNDDLTDIVFVFDMSGSMLKVREEALLGVNHFISEQAALSGEARLTLLLFNDKLKYVHRRAAMLPLAAQDYLPAGYTALYHAVGTAIEDHGEFLAWEPEARRPGRVILAVMTDGLENHSGRMVEPGEEPWGFHRLREVIERQQNEYNWSIIWIASEPATVDLAGDLGVRPETIFKYDSDKEGTTTAAFNLTREVTAIRNNGRVQVD